MKFEDLGLKLPELPPTQVISIRLPSNLLNELKALSSERDIPYQALIKLFLSQSVSKFKKAARRLMGSSFRRQVSDFGLARIGADNGCPLGPPMKPPLPS